MANAIPLDGWRRVSTLTVLRVVHRDIVRTWNFTDPDEILVGNNFRRFIRALFVDSILSPHLEFNAMHATHHQSNENDAVAKIGHAILNMNPAQGVMAATGIIAEVLDQVAFSSAATARVLMAYVTNLTLGMESLFWLIKSREDKKVANEDILRAYMTYYNSKTMKEVHTRVNDYIGDEELVKAFKRDQAAETIKQIVEAHRFKPEKFFSPSQSTDSLAISSA